MYLVQDYDDYYLQSLDKLSSPAMSLIFARTYATIKPHVPMIRFRKGGPSLASASAPAAPEQQTAPAAAAGLTEDILRI